MILLPDYPDRVIRQHRVRVEKIALSVTFLLILSATWWLFSGLFGSAELLPRMGPISLIFVTSLVIIDLIDYGLIQKSRLGVLANISYPGLLALSFSNVGINDSLISCMIYLIIAIFLLIVARKNLSATYSSRKWRGLTSIFGLAFSASILYSLSSEINAYLIIFTIVVITMIPDLMSKDENHKSRKKFIKKGDVHSHPEWRNVECAMSSTRRVVKIAERYNKKIHVLHVTTKEEVDFLAMHKKNVTFETTPQHLTLYAPDCYNKLGTYAQMNPPLRSKEHYDRLWVAIKNNIVDVLGSAHAPH